MSRIQAQLRKIEREEKKRLAESRRQQRIAEKKTRALQQKADPVIAARRLLGVERRRARRRAMAWIAISIIVAVFAISYLIQTIPSWWPSETPLPQ